MEKVHLDWTKRFSLLCFFVLFFFAHAASRELITCIPQYPTDTEPVTIIFDASQGNGSLAWHNGSIYTHTGVTTNADDWLYATSWVDLPTMTGGGYDKYKLTPIGDNKWTLNMPDGIRAFYNVPQGEDVRRLCFVFRGDDGFKEGKTAAGEDIYLGLNKQVSTSPRILKDDNSSVTFIFDALQGEQTLKDYAGDIYAHTGLITNTSGAWQYATNWGDDSGKYKLEPLGNNKWSLTMPNGLRAYYDGVPANEVIEKVMFVFRGVGIQTANIAVNVQQASSPVTTNPDFAFVNQPVTITFNSQMGNRALKEHAGDIYAHTGVITDLSSNISDWKHTTTWNENLPKHKLIPLGNGMYQLSLPDIRAFYAVPAGESIEKLVFVFRDENGTKVAKTADDKDIVVDVYQQEPAIRFDQPEQYTSTRAGETLTFSATSSTIGNLSLYIDNEETPTPIRTEAGALSIEGSYTFTQAGVYTVCAKVESDADSYTVSKTISVIAATIRQTMPNGVRAGINYDAQNNTQATLVFQAPYKQTVYVIGDFNDWSYSTDYQMKQDGEYFWLTLTGLTPGKEYAFQYVVDGNLYIADPYTEKVLDPGNDPYIPASVYPNLKPYPNGKAEGIVSILQTGQEPFNWAVNDFKRPAKDNLIIYEMHLRDFTQEGSYKAALEKLPYLKTLGITAIELMPINEFEGNDSWGYNPSFYFAVDKAYGTKNDLKLFIDECHKQGIAVILDIVLNHSFGQSPLLHLYQGEDKQPLAHNPWYNQYNNFSNPDAQWGVDFNHESSYTRALVDSVAGFWLKEYRIDGIRYDFTKGFSNTPYGENDSWGNAYDPARIYNLERMSSEVWKRSKDAYVIFEHLTPKNEAEEKALANKGIMIWRNMNEPYCQSAMGWSSDSKFTNLFDWDEQVQMPTNSIVGYMESHDEERTTYRASVYGIESIKGSLERRLKQAAVNAAFFLTVPGPKMIWQFGELGYDYSIDENGRTGAKPVKWEYYDADERKYLYDIYSKLLTLRQSHPELFSTRETSDFQWYVSDMNWENGRFLYCQASNGKKMSIAGNFTDAEKSLSVYFPQGGTWHEYMRHETFDATAGNNSITIPANEFRLYLNFDPGERHVYTSDLTAAGKLAGFERLKLKAEGWTEGKVQALAAALKSGESNTTLKELNMSEVTSLYADLDGLLHGFESLTNVYLPEGTYSGSIFNEATNANCFIHFPEDNSLTNSYPESWTNVIEGGVAQTEITIHHEYPFYLGRAFEVEAGKTITYTRTFAGAGKSGGWETICLPFEPTGIQDVDKGAMTPVAQGQTGNYWLKSFSESEGTGLVSFDNVSAFQAGTPYIIAFPGKEWGNSYKESWDITFSGSNGGSFDSGEQAKTEKENYHFVGFINPVENDTDVPLYYILNRETNAFSKETESQKHFHACFVDAPGANARVLSLEMRNGSTGLDGLTIEEEMVVYGEKGRVFIRTTKEQVIQIYYTNGQLAYSQTLNQGDNTITLPQGVYIINKNKVVVY